MIKDIALTFDGDAPERIMAHRIDCLMVQDYREQLKPVLTMFDIQNPIPPHIKKHKCLEEL